MLLGCEDWKGKSKVSGKLLLGVVFKVVNPSFLEACYFCCFSNYKLVVCRKSKELS